MKKLYITSLAALLLTACGNNKKNSTESIIEKGNLQELRQKRSELVTEADALTKEIELIDNAIGKLDDNQKLALITTFTAKDSIFDHYLELQADVQTKENIVLNAEYAGTLQKVYVTEGQKVSKGQTLAKIDDGGLSQQLAQLEIQANLAKTTYERQENLWNQKIGSEIQYLQAKSNYEAQAKAVAQLQSQIAKTYVKAPFSGTIDDVITDQGSAVAPGSQLIRIVNLSNMYLEAEVPEKYVGSVKKGTDVNVNIPVLNEVFTTKINQASDYINPGNRSFKILINITNKKGTIKPNLTSKISIKDYTNPKVIAVPLSIVSENAEGEQYVYITEKQENNLVAKKVIVKTGKTQGDLVEILEGIKDGDQIVKEGARSVKDGQKVSIIK
ncbi:efflux RND transporter periplasmic adaptor subunit [Flavobacterium sp. NRK F10]|uniref:efflux RND transporter periplasmic adaptor subunit n=1 Tax=Flavobacterium sp. NRK F10 TaxID=2954931 RepID=UPI00209038AE|nr:efflux RND transporter periplasmic adaptor subunit [Flavobacterium sp. NRK F10]MCO6174916.1 efflux RND transporter periplasmic adaptor subunit [Flavobacterium sp. NRK F10]